jgi:pyruvate ferredoxin oxidoreductase beta subunit/oxalate oxidoreductase subunit beta
MNKVRKALNVRGPTFLHIHAPCPKGWKFDEARTVEIARLAIETGMWNLYEWVDGEYRYQYEQKQLKPVGEYLKVQKRFAHLDETHIANIQAFVDAKHKTPGVPGKVPTPLPREA